MMQKAVNAEAKIDLNSSIMVRDLDICCPRSYHPSHTTSTNSKVQTLEIITKEFYTKETSIKEIKSANSKIPVLPYSNKPIKPHCQEMKKKYRKKKQDQKKFTLAIRDNAIKNEKKKSDKNYYNYLKKGHYAQNCPESPKNQC